MKNALAFRVSAIWRSRTNFTLKMISAKHFSFNYGKILVTRKTSQHVNILNKGKKNVVILNLSSRLREKKTELEVIYISIKTHGSH